MRVTLRSEGAKKPSKHIVMTAEEELGFRTVGWPQRMEEIGLYIDAWGGVVELGFYRERGRFSVSASQAACVE